MTWVQNEWLSDSLFSQEGSQNQVMIYIYKYICIDIYIYIYMYVYGEYSLISLISISSLGYSSALLLTRLPMVDFRAEYGHVDG